MFMDFITDLSIFLQNLMMIFLMVILSYKSLFKHKKLIEKVQLILQLLHPYTFIPISTVIREMRVLIMKVICYPSSMYSCSIKPGISSHSPLGKLPKCFVFIILQCRALCCKTMIYCCQNWSNLIAQLICTLIFNLSGRPLFF